MGARKYRHEWSDLASIDSDFIKGWGAFDGYRGPLDLEGFEPSKAEMEHDEERDVIRIFYVTQAGELIRETVSLERAACHYDKPDSPRGGRVYFRAPCCGQRVRKLAFLQQGVRCARCGSITSSSRRKSGVQRTIHKADLIAGRLGCKTWYEPPTERPKGMRRETFNRLADEHARLVEQAMAVIKPKLAQASARGGVVAEIGALIRYGM